MGEPRGKRLNVFQNRSDSQHVEKLFLRIFNLSRSYETTVSDNCRTIVEIISYNLYIFGIRALYEHLMIPFCS